MSVALRPKAHPETVKHYTSGLNNEFVGTIFGCGLTLNRCSSKYFQQHDGLFEVKINYRYNLILHKFNVKTHIFCQHVESM